MDKNAAHQFMKDFFENYYNCLHEKSEMAVMLPGVPEDMIADAQPDGNHGEWRVWKLVPSTVTEHEIAALEADFALVFPEGVKAFLSTYHHLFEEPIGRNSTAKKFYGIKQAFNPHLAANGFLPLTWDKLHYFIRCIDLSLMPDEERCPVLEIDHETLFDLQYQADERGEIIPKDILVQHMNAVAENLYDYLNDIYEDAGIYGDDEDLDDEENDESLTGARN